MRVRRRVLREAARGSFRLPGFGGAALYLRSVVVPHPDTGEPVRRCDTGLLCPDFHARYLARPMSAGTPAALSSYLRSAASEWQPEETLGEWSDPALGLDLAVVASTPDRVAILARIVADQGDGTPEPVGLEFETSRAALAQAAIDARRLDCLHTEPDDLPEPPAEWGGR